MKMVQYYIMILSMDYVFHLIIARIVFQQAFKQLVEVIVVLEIILI